MRIPKLPPEPILVSDPDEEPVYALICLIKGPDLETMRERLRALPTTGPKSEYVVVLAEILKSGEFCMAYHDTYKDKVLGQIEEVKRKEQGR